jgi:hypothetical protein
VVSTYCSDPLDNLGDLWNGPYGIDVASDVRGIDVRVLLDHRSAYLTPEEARRMASALIAAADATESWAEETYFTPPAEQDANGATT